MRVDRSVAMAAARRRIAGWWLLPAAVVASALVGCRSGPGTDEPSARVDAADFGPAPTYVALAAEHNRRVSRVQEYYASGSVEVEWMDEEGERHREVGEGNFIFIKPDDVALTFRKLGEVYLWWGADAERLWMFWGGEASKAYVARSENVLHPACEPLPMPVHPAELLDLYAVSALPESGSLGVSFDEERAAWVIEAPARSGWRRIYFDARDGLPERVELLGADGRSVFASADLSEYAPMDVRGLGPGFEPPVPTRMIVRGPDDSDSQGRLEVSVSNPSDKPPTSDRIRPATFDFEAIRANMRPDEMIVLDARCSNPALPPP